MKDSWVTITKLDGTKQFINKMQIVYVNRDAIDDSGRKTEIMTTQGSFIINKAIEEVMSVLSGERKGEL